MSATKEHFNGQIEHESRNQNQGKTQKQIEDSKKLYTTAVIVIVFLVFALLVVGIINDFGR